MRCPYCASDQDKVLESRALTESNAIRRRRECIDCGGRFTSYERIEDKPLMVKKKDGNKELYQKEKIVRGILRAIEKRPVSGLQVEEMVEEITEQLYKKPGREVETSDIGNIVMQRLEQIDQVAYVRFASVYKKFKDVREFIAEIKNM